MLNRPHNFVVCLAIVLSALATGCSSEGLRNGDLSAVQIGSTKPHAGNVYLIRGWIGVFSTGMDQLGEQLDKQGIRSTVYQDGQHNALADQIAKVYKGKTNNSEPLVLIGHSYGADDVVTVARRLNEDNIPIDLLVTVDATTPPDVPKNVKLCYNYFQSNATDVIPMFRGIPLTPDSDAKNAKIYNIDLRKDRKDLLEEHTNHINIDKNMKLHEVLVNHVLEVCPPRAVWAARHGMPSTQPAIGTAAVPARSSVMPAADQARIAQ
jgi:pimeloyl-ACP methyl ester carboxylesterase